MHRQIVSITGSPVDFEKLVKFVENGNEIIIEKSGKQVALISPINSQRGISASEEIIKNREAEKRRVGQITSEIFYG